MTTPITQTQPHETATWTFKIGEEAQHVFLAEQTGWRIVRQDRDDVTGLVTITGIRILRSWNKEYFGD